ncbi:MAG TPA: flagellar hook basal-body protein [Anaeromyxobacteraceae bacterium]|jgi:flagellar basal-body rod protein FlgF
MADGMYVAMCGAAARAEQLEAVADNLANAQTPGFKSTRPAFESFLPASGARDKAHVAAVATGFDLRPGPTVATGNPLDVLPEGGAFLAVRLGPDRVAFTRDGRLALDAERRLVASGRPVLDRQGNPIFLPQDAQPSVDARGVVRAGDEAVAEIGLWRLDGPADRVGPTLLAPGRGGTAVPAEAGVRTGEIELGNTPPIEAAVQLVSAQRAFDTSMQALQTYRRLDDRSTELGRVR